MEAFNASFTPRLRSVKLGATGADYNQPVGNASFNTELPAARITQNYSTVVVSASQGHTSTVAGLTGQTISIIVVSAQTAVEVARWQVDAKPIGQWTVGTDVISDTASTLFPVILTQNILDFEVSNATQGHTVVAPTGNTNLVQAVANATLGHTATPVVFNQDNTLATGSPEQGHTVAAPTLDQPATNMGVESASMGHAVIDFTAHDPGVNLDQNQAQGVASADMVCEVTPPTLFLVPGVPTPAIRIFTPSSEDRTYVPQGEIRVLQLAA